MLCCGVEGLVWSSPPSPPPSIPRANLRRAACSCLLLPAAAARCAVCARLLVDDNGRHVMSSKSSVSRALPCMPAAAWKSLRSEKLRRWSRPANQGTCRGGAACTFASRRPRICPPAHTSHLHLLVVVFIHIPRPSRDAAENSRRPSFSPPITFRARVGDASHPSCPECIHPAALPPEQQRPDGQSIFSINPPTRAGRDRATRQRASRSGPGSTGWVPAGLGAHDRAHVEPCLSGRPSRKSLEAAARVAAGDSEEPIASALTATSAPSSGARCLCSMPMTSP